jgi:hypothetical protein
MKHGRLDSLLLAGVGTLAVHEIAYLPGSVATSVSSSGVSHAHLPLMWGLGGAVAIGALVHYVVGSLRRRSGDRFVDPLWIGLAMGAFFTSQEAAERAMSGSPAVSLVTEWALWIGLIAVPLVALVLARLVRCITGLTLGPEPRPVTHCSAPDLFTPARAEAVLTVVRLAHSVARRGPPLRSVF